MGLWSWLMSLGEPTPRSRDKIHQKDLEKQAKGKAMATRRSRRHQPQVASTLRSSSPEPTGHAETNFIQPLRTPEILPETQAGIAAAGLARTRAELDAIHNAAHNRMQQAQMSQAQMNAAWGAMQQESAFLHGTNDPLQGIMGQPYWKTYYGEIGKNLGPFHPKGGK